ncbi:MAG: DUF2141 domain-containing protein [Chitinophagales bacterium]
MHTKLTYFTLAFFLFTIFSESKAQENHSLTVNISNIKDNVGLIHLAIYRPDDNFPYEGGAFREYNTKAIKGSTVYVMENLPAGDYAVTMFHDENQSGECETNFIGFPLEGYCFSRNFKVFLSAPPFSKCGFTLDEDKAIDVKMRY